MLSRILYVADQEKFEYTDDGLKAILYTAQGDMRQVGVHPFHKANRFFRL